LQALQDGHLLAISLAHAEHAADIAALVQELQSSTGAPIVPVFCGSLDGGATPRVRIVFGEATTATSLAELQAEIQKHGDWIQANDDKAGGGHH
jgi:hypothetical protein